MPSDLCGQANGLDLVLLNADEFDQSRFISLVKELGRTSIGDEEPQLINQLTTLASNPRLRWPVELYAPLLWWTSAGDQGAAAAAAAVWRYLFGAPPPQWCKLDADENVYELNAQSWKAWYDGLRHRKPGQAC